MTALRGFPIGCRVEHKATGWRGVIRGPARLARPGVLVQKVKPDGRTDGYQRVAELRQVFGERS